jgi:hypothetical protein
MKEMERRQRKEEKAARKAVRKMARMAAMANWEECQWLLCVIFVTTYNYQVHPVYPSDTGNLEWHDPAPESDHDFPRSPDDEWNKFYYND